MIKAIICDLGGVYFRTGTNEALKKIYKIIKAPRQKIDEFFHINNKNERWLYGKGKLTKREFWEAAAKKLTINKRLIPKLEEIWHSFFKPDREMKELIFKLRKNYKVIVFSGTIKERVEYLNKNYNLFNSFDDFVLSFGAGFNKDEIGFYKVLLKKLKKLKLKPEECIFIDDHQEFLDKAKKFGIKTILFKNPQKLKSDLRKLGLKI